MKKVLLVEDDITTRDLLQTLLKLEGFNPVSYQENHEKNILDTIQSETPDIVIVDVHLKYANGLDVLRQIRQTKMFESTQIILTSGLDYSEQCYKLGANGFLQKPYMPDELLKLLKK